MATQLDIEPKRKRRAGETCTCSPVAPTIDDAAAARLVAVARALADPVRLRLVDVLRDHPGKVCPCELAPLFELSQPTISHHLKVLKDAGILESEKHGLFVYYYVRRGALAELTSWLTR
jgi:ArsR family transcriptional regulator, arsenate/arsenite/antimonite-responsive transcriptional repressor